MNIMSSKINYIFNQGFQDSFTSGYIDTSSVNITQSSTKEGGNINFISDSNLNNRSSTEKGLAEYFDVSFCPKHSIKSFNQDFNFIFIIIP